MMIDYETVEKTIELVCEKFGIAIDSTASLIPSVVSYKVGSDIMWTILGIAAIVAAIYLAKKAIKKRRSEDYESWRDSDTIFGLGITSGLLGVIGLAVISCAVNSIIKWTCMPEIAFIEYVMNFLG